MEETILYFIRNQCYTSLNNYIYVMWLIIILLFPTLLGDIKLDETKLARFLEKIKMLESSGGRNLEHREMDSGIHSGDSAYGSYGLMPNTIRELVNRKRLEGNTDYQNLYKQDSEHIKNILTENPDQEEALAKELADRVLQKASGDEERAAYGWNMGHNQNLKDLPSEKLDNNKYIQEFRLLKEKLGVR